MKLNEKSYTQPFIEQISYHVYETDIIAPENEETDTASETEATMSIHDFSESREELDKKSCLDLAPNQVSWFLRTACVKIVSVNSSCAPTKIVHRSY